MTGSRKLKLFLCHASQDKPVVRELYRRLSSENEIDPWLDEEKLLPGQDWDLEIEKAVEASDAVIVCISSRSVTKEGYVQKELRKVLDIALEKPEETIFIIPIRLDDCELPRRLRAWHYVDYFPADRKDWAFRRLLESLRVRHTQGLSQSVQEERVESAPTKFTAQESEPENKASLTQSQASVDKDNRSRIDLAGMMVLLVYLLGEVFAFLGDSGTFLEYWKLVFAILAGLYFVFRRQFPDSKLFKVAFSTFLVLDSLVHYVAQRLGVPDVVWPILGVAALVAGGALIAALRTPTKPALYSSILIASYFFLTAVELILQATEYYESPIFSILLLLSVVISILLWLDL